MKGIILTTSAVIVLVLGSVTSASAAPFYRCSDVRATYPGGIAKVGVKGNRNQYTHRLMAFQHRPKFSTALYKKYSFMDADHDGVACEG
jgi:hypothetical protein